MEDIEALIRFTPQEQAQNEKEQNLFSIIKTIEFLEFAYMNGKVLGPQYDLEFRSLFHQYNMCTQSIPNFIGIDKFMTELNLDHCQSAKIRIKAGKSNYSGEDTQRNLAQRVFDITTKFITPIDVLELGMTSIDEIAPPIRDVYQALNNYPNMPATYTGLATIGKWVKILDTKKATDNLNPEEVRSLKYDLGQAL